MPDQIFRLPLGGLPNTVSISDLEEDNFQLSDNGQAEAESYGNLFVEAVAKSLTNKQREVVELLMRGLTRKEVAKDRGVVLQSVHQIIPRIRKRLKDRGIVTDEAFGKLTSSGGPS